MSSESGYPRNDDGTIALEMAFLEQTANMDGDEEKALAFLAEVEVQMDVFAGLLGLRSRQAAAVAIAMARTLGGY